MVATEIPYSPCYFGNVSMGTQPGKKTKLTRSLLQYVKYKIPPSVEVKTCRFKFHLSTLHMDYHFMPAHTILQCLLIWYIHNLLQAMTILAGYVQKHTSVWFYAVFCEAKIALIYTVFHQALHSPCIHKIKGIYGIGYQLCYYNAM